jgi:pyruvate-ferredoxin/flavodoxin oxidoreductase
VDFVRETPANPKDEIHNQNILEAYPRIRELAVRGSENPNLLPKDSITVRMHSVGGWGAITTGKNLAMTLYELLGWDIKANPKYGSEKKGQPTTYYLSAAPEPIRVNCEYVYVDVVLSPDPNVHEHSNPVAGLKKGGVFIVQSNRSAEPISGRASRCGCRSRSSTTTSASSTSMPSRSPARRPARPTCSCACRASPSRAPSSPPAR